MNRLLDLLEDKRKRLLFFLVLIFLVLSALLGMIVNISKVHEAFETPGIWWNLGMLGLTFVTLSSLTVLLQSRAFYSLEMRLLSIAIIGLMSLLYALLLWGKLSNAWPVLNTWENLARWLLAVPAAGSLLAVFLYWRNEVTRAKVFRVLITQFSEGAKPEKPEDRTLHRLVLEPIEELASDIEGFEMVHLDEVVLEEERARKLGENAQASVVMYGFYSLSESKVLLNIHFEVIREPEYYYPLSIDRQTVDIEALKSFTLHTDLANEAAYLAAFLLGMFKYSKAEYTGAAEAFKRALALQTQDEERLSDAALHTFLGNTFYYSASVEQAFHEYNIAVEINPSYAKAWHNLGATCILIGECDDPLDFFDKAIDLDSNLLVSYRGRGTAWLARGEYTKAIDDFSQVLRQDPCNVDVLLLRARSYCSAGEHEYALKDLKKALGCDQSMHTVIAPAIAQEYCHLNEAQKAIKLSEHLVKNPDCREVAYYCMGVALEQFGDLSSAVEAYAKSIPPDACDPQRYLRRGDKYLDLGQTVLAIEDYTSAIRLDPDSAIFYHHRARAHAEQGEFGQAIADYTSTIDRVERGTVLLDALLFRGQIYCQLDEYGEAIEDFDKCISLGGIDARIYTYKGYALMGLGEFEKAIVALRVAKEKDPHSQKVVELLGKAHYSLAYRLLGEGERQPTRCQATRIIHHLISAIENGMQPRSKDFSYFFNEEET